MKLLLVLLSVAGVSGLVLVSPVGTETGGLASLGDKETGRRGESSSREIPQSPSYEVCSTGRTPATQLRANPPVPQSSSVDLLAQEITRVTAVEVNQTPDGLELILNTVAGSERLVPLILPQGNDLVIDILDATLAFSIRNGVSELNPAPRISRVTVNKGDENR